MLERVEAVWVDAADSTGFLRDQVGLVSLNACGLTVCVGLEDLCICCLGCERCQHALDIFHHAHSPCFVRIFHDARDLQAGGEVRGMAAQVGHSIAGLRVA
jgi:hypothetical protein